ncbi:putative nucleic-acid-binding protein [Rhizobium petrolearium]|uniref:PIN domain-containing protein n=1 Tax=Neorhizobium petrolearium TaxID=515361 RepID=UPI001AE101DC|nr:type II toxin-antitoxin system VapC family toxin [Neorhizobium petrolearium]MBP1846223.1 putative nucleic-acid-binding protein [Neorhizobium petrolearium]
MMIFGLDTNVILRLFIDDDPAQRAAALGFGERLGKDYSAFVTLISLLELDWALRSQYGFSKKHVTLAIDKLLHTRGLVIKNHTLVVKALRFVESNNADFADALIACRLSEEGCQSTKTFDMKAARKVPGMELLT